VAWVSSIAKADGGRGVAIDGKTLRGASEPSKKGPDKKGHRAYGFGLGQQQLFGARSAPCR